ncbi:hypothetical protein DXG01_011767 [Tephrocybe rancida]|nr:hypothetical protein DXG01_011767 [Tephrocybe rancida]
MPSEESLHVAYTYAESSWRPHAFGVDDPNVVTYSVAVKGIWKYEGCIWRDLVMLWINFTMLIKPAYAAPPDEECDPYHRSNSFIKGIDNLHLMSFFTPDYRRTCDAGHANINDPIRLAPDKHATEHGL